MAGGVSNMGKLGHEEGDRTSRERFKIPLLSRTCSKLDRALGLST